MNVLTFERSCRRVLKTEVIKPGAVSNVSSKFAAAKKNGFFFLPSQKITRSIKHLHYKNVNDIPAQKDYKFNIPHYFRAELKKMTLSKVGSSPKILDDDVPDLSTDDHIIHSVSPYNPIPDMFIPLKYRDIIPPDPIYDDNGSFIIPGSREWSHIYRLDLDTRDEHLKKAEMARIAEAHAYWDNESKARIEARLKADATYYSTSPKYVDYRRKEKKQKIKVEMDTFINHHPNITRAEAQHRKNFRINSHDNKGKAIITHPYTSDETKELEERPLKRTTDNNNNIPLHQGISKRTRLDTFLALDSEQAGSSK
ncbi:hypothetical protein RhiirA4_470026 [Rhizophagus irregularis]|uniref:DUF8211 domain-containing protein n=1 Tax=Rhizophagus irregularis TaxID=588596 RepID=A0A2I1H0K1_9GLOM|nr:hypothetical protein RhiirA4_470026 [Rhizophagus irregularis]